MPNIVLPNGEVVYRPMSDSVWSVLSELSAGGVNEAAVFNGKKLAVTAEFASIPQLTDTASIHIICRPAPPALPPIDADLFQTYTHGYELLTDEEMHVVRDYMCSPSGIRRALSKYPILRTDDVGMDLLRNFPLLWEVMISDKLPPAQRYLFNVFVDGMEANRARRPAVIFSDLSSSSSSSVSRRLAVAVSPPVGQPTITSQMLQQALNMFGGPSNSAAAAPARQAVPAQQPAAEAMEVGPDYTRLRQLYSEQLTQMRDFGFINDEENLRTLQMCDGILERALELIITMRESEQN